MGRERLRAYRERVGEKLESAFSESHPPREVAASFSLGVFITALPTLGTGVLLFFLIVAISDRVSKLALFASVVVLNPPVKWGVYAASFSLGTALLGPVPGVTLSDVSLAAGPAIVLRLLVGNLVIAVVCAAVGYVAALRLVRAYRRRDVAVTDLLPGEFLE